MAQVSGTFPGLYAGTKKTGAKPGPKTPKSASMGGTSKGGKKGC